MKTFIAIDFETAGRYDHSACAVGMVKIENMQITDSFYRLIRPPSSTVLYTDIHGLTWNDLKSEKSFRDVWYEGREFITGSDYFIAHYAVFDRKILKGCCEYFCHNYPVQPFLCTCKGARKLIRQKSHALNNVCKTLGIELNHHHALSDAMACAEVFLNLNKLYVERNSCNSDDDNPDKNLPGLINICALDKKKQANAN